MSLSIWGLGTSLPEHTMTQDEALEMTSTIVSEDERQRRLLRMLFRKSAVQNRHTCVPHPIAYEWSAEEGNGEAEDNGSVATVKRVIKWGPTTRERMQL